MFYPIGGPFRPPAFFPAYLPEGLDLSVVPEAQRAYAAWLVSTIVFRRYIDGARAETFVPLYSGFVLEFVPKHVRKSLTDRLKEHGILECDEKKVFGNYVCPWMIPWTPLGKNGNRGKCYFYRLGERFRGSRIVIQNFDHRELMKNVVAASQKNWDEITDPTHLALRAWHSQVEVLPSAPRGEHPLLDVMMDGERRFKVCLYGRVHTNVTNLPRQHRQHLRLAGRELTSVDVTAAQPLLLAKFLGLHREIKAAGGEEAGREGSRPIYGYYWDIALSNLLEDCRTGGVYDKLVELTGKKRGVVKKRFLTLLYDEPRAFGDRFALAVRKLYPGLMDRIEAIYYEKGHGWIAREMQRMESRVMIERVAGRLIRERPQMPLLTVHDCVAVPDEDVSYVRDVILDEWAAEYGLVPTLKESPFMAKLDARAKSRSKRGRRRKKRWPIAA